MSGSNAFQCQLPAAGKYDYNKDREGEEGEVSGLRVWLHCGSPCATAATAVPRPPQLQGRARGSASRCPFFIAFLSQDVNKDDAGEDLADALHHA